jgi:hypothetical protein
MRYSEFKTEAEFKKYLRREKILMAEYFEKFEPRYDLYSNEKIKYKDRSSYLSTYFTDKRNMSKWLKIQDKDTALNFIEKGFKFRKEKDDFQFVPCQVESRSLKEVPSINAYPYIEETIIWKNLNLKQRFVYGDIDYKFDNLNEAIIGIDTREKNKLEFNGIKTIAHKFDFGDYGFINEPYFCNIFFERKSIIDLWGTMSKNYDRFCREIERAKDAGAYVIVVIDYSYSKATGYNFNKRYSKSTSKFVFHRIRKMLQTYDNVQFLFSGGREQSEYLIKRIGEMGENAKIYDLQYLLDTKKIK